MVTGAGDLRWMGRKQEGPDAGKIPDSLGDVLAYHCAPVLMGRKAANLLIVDRAMEPYVENGVEALEWEPHKVSTVLFYSDSVKSVFFLYNRRRLEAYLERIENRRFLGSRGYPCGSLEQDIDILKSRYLEYRRGGGDFPHEIGLLLGYPLWDVKGFIDHKGRKSLYTGYWKVYDRLPQARRLFQEYERCRMVMTGRTRFSKENTCYCQEF